MSKPEVQHVYPADDPTHDTDGGFCWCQPETEDVPPNGLIVIHRRSLDSPHREAASPEPTPGLREAAEATLTPWHGSLSNDPVDGYLRRCIDIQCQGASEIAETANEPVTVHHRPGCAVAEFMRRAALAASPAPEPTHGVAIWGDYGVTCSCTVVLDWPGGWSRNEVAAGRLVARHAAPEPTPGLREAAQRVDEAWDVKTNAYDLTTFVPRTTLDEMYERLRDLRRALAASPAPEPTGLDAAWAEAEAALPEGIFIYGMYALNPNPKMNQYHPHVWRVEAGNAKDRTQDVWATGETWEAALRALAARLGEKP